ncbi:MAG: response regulator transcription factor [Clostridia bacterium]|nr:response regulator transcription factor [Clostridia bacterium]
MRVLIAEDEYSISDFIKRGLEKAGFSCGQAFDGEAACDMADENEYDLVLLDVMLPKADGFEVMEYIRNKNTPVIFITARSSVQDRVRGLTLGADDYLVKPFEMIELLARIDAVMRRLGRGSKEVKLGDVVLNLQSRMCFRAGEEVKLSGREFDLAVFMMQNANTALFRETIYEHVWREDYMGDTRTIDLHVMRLRKKLGWEERLKTVSRIGYRLNGEK